MKKTKKLFAAALAALTMAAASVSNVFAFAFGNWISAYRNELTYINNNPAFFNIDPDYGFGYTINDIDKDGIKELIVLTGTCEADYVYRFYTYSDGKIIFLGSMPGGHIGLYGCDGNGIFGYWSHMGYESLDRIVKNGNTIYTTTVYNDIYVPIDGDYHEPKFPLTMIEGTDFSYLYLPQ